jgi:hypothetical protein
MKMPWTAPGKGCFFCALGQGETVIFAEKITIRAKRVAFWKIFANLVHRESVFWVACLSKVVV